jgi:hypothetical protein
MVDGRILNGAQLLHGFKAGWITIKRVFELVVAGLDPAIHLLRKRALRRVMDTRVKPAYDERGC